MTVNQLQISSESMAKKTNQLNAAQNFLLRHPWLRVYKNSYTRKGVITIDVTELWNLFNFSSFLVSLCWHEIVTRFTIYITDEQPHQQRIIYFQKVFYFFRRWKTKNEEEWIKLLRSDLFCWLKKRPADNRRADIINKQTVYRKHKWNFQVLATHHVTS